MGVKFENEDHEIFALTADTDLKSTFSLILEHLSVLEDKRSFPSSNMNKYDWVHNPFAVTTEDTKFLPLRKAEELVDLQADQTF